MGLFLPCHPKTGRKHRLMAEALKEGSNEVLPNEALPNEALPAGGAKQ